MKFCNMAVVVPVDQLTGSKAALSAQVWGQVSNLLMPALGKLYRQFHPANDAWGHKLTSPFGVVLGCFLANLLGSTIVDVIFGTLATLLACLVAVDGLGSNGIAPKDLFHINSKADWCADWLDFMDMISEGIAMPLGAMLMSIMVGWEIKPKSLYGEIDSGYNGHIHGFYTFCIKYLCPVIMFFILLVQISTFFGLGWFN